MAKKLGNDYRLWIESTTPGTFNQILGQQDLSMDESGGTIDTSSKDDFPYGTQAPGLRSVTINFSIIPNLPDVTGFTRFESIATATTSTTLKVQIRKGGSAGTDTDKVFEGTCYITNFNKSFGMNDAVKATGSLVAAAAPTTNALS